MGRLTAFIVAIVVAQPCFSAQFVVDITDDRPDPVPGDGVCGLPAFISGGPWCSLRAAVQEANELAGLDTIVLGNQVYALTEFVDDDDDFAANGDLNVFDDLAIQGDSAVIDGSNLSRIFEVESSRLILSGVTLSNASSATDGGAVFAISSSVEIDNSQFVGNVAEGDGGAIYLLGGSLLIEQSRFDQNIAGLSGGAITVEDSSIDITGTVFFDNYAEQGGAIYASLVSKLLIEDTDFWANTAGHFGGGVMLEDVALPNGLVYDGSAILDIPLAFSRVKFGGNEAAGGAGGGIYIDSLFSSVNEAVMQISDCDFQDNSGYSGGAVAIYSGQVNFDACNFVNNESTGEDGVGGAIFSNGLLSLNSVSLTQNTTYFDGAAIYASSDLAFIESTAGDNDLQGDGEFLGSGIVVRGTLVDEAPSDSDEDGILDGNDNCPYVANPDQANSGGTSFGVVDTIGDACQCGDVNDSGTVDNTDAVLIVRFSAGLPPGINTAKCDVNGDEICDDEDADRIRAYLLDSSTQNLQQCSASQPLSNADSNEEFQSVDGVGDSQNMDEGEGPAGEDSQELLEPQEFNVPMHWVATLLLACMLLGAGARRYK